MDSIKDSGKNMQITKLGVIRFWNRNVEVYLFLVNEEKW